MNLTGCGAGLFVSFSNDGTIWGPTPELSYDSANPSTAWTIAGGNGERVISGRARVGIAGEPWILPQQSIILDTTSPTTPVPFTRTAGCSGSTRTVNLSWGASSDSYLVGYRVYRSTDGVNWQIVKSTTTTSATDTHSKGLASVRYYVKAYDKAGNESNATSTITLSKNQCS
jgi:fibronectin type 3 domain-containing protein